MIKVLTKKKAKKQAAEKQPTGIKKGLSMNRFVGYTAKCEVTGFTGVIICYFSCLTGCDQYQLQPKVKDGAHVSSRWFDCNKLVLTKAKRVVLDAAKENPGCDT